MESMFLLLTDILYSGFALFTLLLFILKLAWRAKGNFWSQLLFSSNLLLLIVSSLYTLYYLAALSIVFFNGLDTQNFRWRALGPYWFSYWIMIMGRTLLPQILWIKKCRKHYGIALLLAFLAISSTLLERLAIFLTSLYRDYLPSSWIYYGTGFFEAGATLGIYSLLVLLVYAINGNISNRIKLPSGPGRQ